jgi:hypothetical protein
MRKLAVIFSALIVGLTGSFSVAASSKLSSLSALPTAYKAKQTQSLQPGHGINIVYGGEDVSNKTILIAPSMTA